MDLTTLNAPEFTEAFSQKVESKLTLFDPSLSKAAFNASSHIDPFNMTTEESKDAGAAIGCDFFILIRTETQRRASIERPEYYEAYAALYAVNSRTGRLIYQANPKAESTTPAAAESNLAALGVSAASDVIKAIATAQRQKAETHRLDNIEVLPVENSPASKNFRTPIPYRRIKPEYTQSAYYYGVKATVEILVDLDAIGSITRTEITRWAGFGLDESVEKAVRSMNWRPAERNGKPLPMRVLLRYNFKKTDSKP